MQTTKSFVVNQNTTDVNEYLNERWKDANKGDLAEMSRIDFNSNEIVNEVWRKLEEGNIGGKWQMIEGAE